jgi:16S rRNA (uracil1498-N3)-methyltransferase
MTRRYFCETPIVAARAELAGSEAHHLLHVARAAPGTQVVLFDGSGCEFEASVLACGRSTVELAVGERRAIDRELPFELTLGVALPKGDRQRWLVEKSVELGVTRLVPLATERCEVHGRDKLERYVIEASKQCGRNRLMEIAPERRWANWLADAGAGADVRRWVAQPDGAAIGGADLACRTTFLAIGPEGGLTEGEVAAAVAAGWQPIRLGPRILRIETAALAIVSALTVGCGSR